VKDKTQCERRNSGRNKREKDKERNKNLKKSFGIVVIRLDYLVVSVMSNFTAF
jgi:hypothetical protein